MTTITYTGRLTIVTCTCGIKFAVPEDLDERALDHRGPNGFHIYCPLGHRWHYVGKTDAEKERERAELAERRLQMARNENIRRVAELDQANARANGYKGAFIKTKKRAEKGQCLHCSKEFVDVAAHVARRHPEVADGDT